MGITFVIFVGYIKWFFLHKKNLFHNLESYRPNLHYVDTKPIAFISEINDVLKIIHQNADKAIVWSIHKLRNLSS